MSLYCRKLENFSAVTKCIPAIKNDVEYLKSDNFSDKFIFEAIERINRAKNIIFLYSKPKLTTSSRFFRLSYRKIISGTCTDELSWRNFYCPRRSRGP